MFQKQDNFSLPLCPDVQERMLDHWDQCQLRLLGQPKMLMRIFREMDVLNTWFAIIEHLTSAYSKGLTDFKGIFVGLYWLPYMQKNIGIINVTMATQMKKINKDKTKIFNSTTLISNISTCLGFASPSINDVATEEPGWVIWKPIPGTSCVIN